ncbi:uncharacterized protein LOC120617738 isoform X3 [Pteropus medius]|uniref:uncharacterized protein LOC120617738 isoform X3 n=1 Tax=Pteropus vampyrus TaxID=132908 RepID=UPI00196ADDEA|nr:uncharacterized protein LOC120617738 isoform X3 [Pteropus giganteus]
MDKPPKHFRFFPSRERERARKRSKMAASQPLRITSCRGVRQASSARPPPGAETAGSRDAPVAVRPRRKATSPPAGPREFLQSEFSRNLFSSIPVATIIIQFTTTCHMRNCNISQILQLESEVARFRGQLLAESFDQGKCRKEDSPDIGVP